jgi:hypothetical protein
VTDKILFRAAIAGLLLLGGCGTSQAPDTGDGGDTSPAGTPFTADVTCDDARATHKNAYFGDMHVHTLYSVDAYFFNGLNGPREAYRFAKGEPESLPAGETDPYTPGRTIQLDRPLDFAAVTDHSDFLGDWRLLCQVDGSLPIGTNPACNVVGTYLRNNITTLVNGDQPAAFTVLTAALAPLPIVTSIPWQDELNIADEENVPCSFSTFPGYEWTSQKHSQMIHRDVYFTGTNLPRDVAHAATPEDLIALATGKETSSNANDDWRIYDYLEQNCDAAQGCQTMTIPHNSNQSNGAMYLPIDPATGLPQGRDAAPLTLADAQLRAKYDRVIEIAQHKGNSECAVGLGIYEDHFDPSCTFELAKNVCRGRPNDPPECKQVCTGDPQRDPDFCTLTTVPAMATGVCEHVGHDGASGPDPKCIAPLDMARNILADGLAIRDTLGINPMHMGFIGSTDTHNGDPGDVAEHGYPGHGGVLDNTPERQLGFWACDGKNEDPADPAHCTNRHFLDFARGFNPGGLAGVWAPENTRQAVWDGFQRGETFATSGPRIRIRTIATWTAPPDDICDRLSAGDNPVDTGEIAGAVMGGDLPPKPEGAKAPYIVVWAQQDPGGKTPGLPLQKLDLVKGWSDASGARHVKVFDAIARTSATVAKPSQSDCSVQTGGHPERLCTVWRDPQFDAKQNAYYYARAFEIPSCRWSTQMCVGAGVQCSALDPANGMFPASSGWQGYEGCCSIDGAPGSFTGRNRFATIEERAWASPIWVKHP